MIQFRNVVLAGGMVALAAGATAPVPKRLRLFLEREPAAIVAVLHIFLRVVEAHLRAKNPRS